MLFSTIIWTLAWPSSGSFCRICPEGVDGQRSPSLSGCTGIPGMPCTRPVWRGGFPQPTPATENCVTWSAVEKRPWPLANGLKGPGPGMEKLAWRASCSSLPRHAPSRQVGCTCTCTCACTRARAYAGGPCLPDSLPCRSTSAGRWSPSAALDGSLNWVEKDQPESLPEEPGSG